MLFQLASKIVKMSLIGLRKEEFHLTRFLEYKSLQGKAKYWKGDKVASISGSRRLSEIIGLTNCEIVELDHPEYDARDLPFGDGSFDVCVADQVLEHVEGDPNSMVSECSRILKEGGYFVSATVMTYPIHYGPKDLWRFTTEGHIEVLERNGFQIVESGSWGGRKAILLLLFGLGGLAVPKVCWHPIRRIAEDPGDGWPVVVWAIGRKQID